MSGPDEFVIWSTVSVAAWRPCNLPVAWPLRGVLLNMLFGWWLVGKF